jgi:hypothetical protein
MHAFIIRSILIGLRILFLKMNWFEDSSLICICIYLYLSAVVSANPLWFFCQKSPSLFINQPAVLGVDYLQKSPIKPVPCWPHHPPCSPAHRVPHGVRVLAVWIPTDLALYVDAAPRPPWARSQETAASCFWTSGFFLNKGSPCLYWKQIEFHIQKQKVSRCWDRQLTRRAQN